jgi:hypothetical protein
MCFELSRFLEQWIKARFSGKFCKTGFCKHAKMNFSDKVSKNSIL